MSPLNKRDLSRFVEDADQWSVLDQIMTEARRKFEDMAPDELDAPIGEAVAAARRSAGLFSGMPRDEGT